MEISFGALPIQTELKLDQLLDLFARMDTGRSGLMAILITLIAWCICGITGSCLILLITEIPIQRITELTIFAMQTELAIKETVLDHAKTP